MLTCADHKSKVFLVVNDDIGTGTIFVDFLASVVENANKTKENEDIGNDGCVRQSSYFADPANGNNNGKNNPDPVFAFKRWIAP